MLSIDLHADGGLGSVFRSGCHRLDCYRTTAARSRRSALVRAAERLSASVRRYSARRRKTMGIGGALTPSRRGTHT